MKFKYLTMNIIIKLSKKNSIGKSGVQDTSIVGSHKRSTSKPAEIILTLVLLVANLVIR